jgi:hypothetical protein
MLTINYKAVICAAIYAEGRFASGENSGILKQYGRRSRPGQEAMEYRILAVGDIVGDQGLEHLERSLRPLQKLKDVASPW